MAFKHQSKDRASSGCRGGVKDYEKVQREETENAPFTKAQQPIDVNLVQVMGTNQITAMQRVAVREISGHLKGE